MEAIQKRLLDALVESEKNWNSAHHILYVIYPTVKDPKLLTRILETLSKGVSINVSAVLQFEHIYKRVRLTSDPQKNLDSFLKVCSARYGLTESSCNSIRELFKLRRKHADSGIEFSKSGKMIIVDDDLKTSELSVEKMKEFLKVAGILLDNSKSSFKSIF